MQAKINLVNLNGHKTKLSKTIYGNNNATNVPIYSACY